MPDPDLAVTDLLVAHRKGEPGAFDRLVEVVYDELRGIAHLQRRGERQNADPQTTALVHELYLKLADRSGDWKDRGHFFAACATAMRHILIDAARRRTREKRGGQHEDLPLDDASQGAEGDPQWLMRLELLMQELEQHDARMVRVFECRYFAGYSNQETANALDLSFRTAQRDWDRARAWLKRELATTVRA
jgi:RNA polymerase sigma factor (TIGR02999 family)